MQVNNHGHENEVCWRLKDKVSFNPKFDNHYDDRSTQASIDTFTDPSDEQS